MTNAEPTEDARLLNAFVDWMNNESEDMETDQFKRDAFEAGWDAHKLETASLTAELAAANAVIANALAQTKRGNVMTPPWVIAALNGEASK